MVNSLLLVVPEPGATIVAHALRTALPATVEIAAELSAGTEQLRRSSFDLVVLEENLAATDAAGSDAIYHQAASAPVLEFNLGLCSADRLVRQVRSTLRRQALHEEKAKKAASLLLQNQLNASVTGLLLESQLALRQAGASGPPALQHVVDLASNLRDHLRR